MYSIKVERILEGCIGNTVTVGMLEEFTIRSRDHAVMALGAVVSTLTDEEIRRTTDDSGYLEAAADKLHTICALKQS